MRPVCSGSCACISRLRGALRPEVQAEAKTITAAAKVQAFLGVEIRRPMAASVYFAAIAAICSSAGTPSSAGCKKELAVERVVVGKQAATLCGNDRRVRL